jgi:hypothetical protein
MANYTFAASLNDCFIRNVKVSAYNIKKANQLAVYELKQLYPNTYHNLEIELTHCNEPAAKCNKNL